MKNCGISPWKVKVDEDELPNTYLPVQTKKSILQQLNKSSTKNIVSKS